MSPVLNQSPSKAAARFLGHIPVAFEDAGAADEQLTIVGDAYLDVRERAAHGAEFAGAGRVDGNDRRSFREAVPLMNQQADLGIPFGKFFP